jgi:steroid 5-alpha reductase family enzyme
MIGDAGGEGRMPDVLTVLAINAGVLLALFALAWALCVAMRDCTPVDSLWALGMGLVAISTYVQAGGATPRRMALTGLCLAWALRLGGYMLWRWRDHGPDRRYVRLLDKAEAERGWGYGYAAFRLVFALQAPLLWLVCLPVQLGQMEPQPHALGPLGLAGAALAVGGLVVESLADWQLVRFKKDPANAGQVLDRGLWRYTRHPNYFGDACVWWGLWLVAAETRLGLLAVVGPVYLVYTLVRWSGVPTVEGRMRRRKPAYEAYMRRTSGFLPWPPKPPEAA